MSSARDVLLSVLFFSAAVLAEINLLRVLIEDWHEARRERVRSGLRQEQTRQRAATDTRHIHTALAATGLTICGTALGQTPPTPALAAAPAQPTTVQAEPNPAAGSAPTPTLDLADSPPALPTPTISTDRPSFSDTASIAPVGRLQLETGYTFTFRDRDGVETQRHNGPELLARVGLIDDRFELRLSTAGYVWSRTDDGSGSGFAASHAWSDLSLGLKLKLTDQDGALPRLALGAATTVGAGSERTSSRRAEPICKLIWSYDLEKLAGERLKGFGVYGNFNASWTTSDGDRYWQGAASICGTYAITDRWGVFAEYAIIFPASKGTGPSHSVDFGTTYLLTPQVQLDARVGFGLNNKADNLFAGAGVSFLF